MKCQKAKAAILIILYSVFHRKPVQFKEKRGVMWSCLDFFSPPPFFWWGGGGILMGKRLMLYQSNRCCYLMLYQSNRCCHLILYQMNRCCYLLLSDISNPFLIENNNNSETKPMVFPLNMRSCLLLMTCVKVFGTCLLSTCPG